MDPTIETTELSGVEVTAVKRPIVFTDDTQAAAASATFKGKTKKRIAHSNYFITVSTNEQFTEFQEEQFVKRAKELEAIYNDVMTHIDKYIVFKEPNTSDTFSPEYFQRIEHDVAFERGKTTGYLHFHALLQISHWSKIKVDFELMRKDLSEGLWGVGTPHRVYLMTRWFADTKQTLESYISKNYEELRKKGIDLA